jgi:hypothetical protein
VKVELVYRASYDRDRRAIHRELLDGSVWIDPPESLLGDDHSKWLSPGSFLSMSTPVTIIERDGSLTGAHAASIRLGGRTLLVVGNGLVSIRLHNGIPVLEPEDPTRVWILPTKGGTPECALESLDVRPDFAFEREDGSGFEYGAAQVVSTVVDNGGCQSMTLEQNDGARAKLRVCLPENLWPFTGEDPPQHYANLPPDPEREGVELRSGSIILSLFVLKISGARTMSTTFTLDAMTVDLRPTSSKCYEEDRCGNLRTLARPVVGTRAFELGERIVDPGGADSGKAFHVTRAWVDAVRTVDCELDEFGIADRAKAFVLSVEHR